MGWVMLGKYVMTKLINEGRKHNEEKSMEATRGDWRLNSNQENGR